ncbi:hypothetical protein KUCAC02_008091 [Chaenocephalus aceratus]|uniref:Uncharacterized protein n=1 Tax=Chaenocephalus aceratus TaxID=36190 RepID=A0ACB9X9A2_CHAAC|nr:hypothetical protein KUCAC02_008091 [Chaenocephalus aceratus]
MGSVGAERRRPTPAQTPEERDVWRDGGRAGWREVGREGWREGRESGVVQSFSFDSYQLEEEEISKDAPERGVLALSEPDFEEPIPDDRYHGIYFAMLLAGVGFLLPYNSFITDVDYLHHKFQGTSIVFDLSLTYILVALLAVILNNVLVERSVCTPGSLWVRGFTITTSTAEHSSACILEGMSFEVCCLLESLWSSETPVGRRYGCQIVFDVWLAKFTTGQAYVVNLVSVGVVAFGCTGLSQRLSDTQWRLQSNVFSLILARTQPPASSSNRFILAEARVSSPVLQQSSFYGYMGMLPKRYTQGVMTGESTAGVIISLSRIFTKLLIPDERRNTLIFFLVSISMEMLCFLLHLLVRRSQFVRYYTSHAQGKGAGKLPDARDNGTGYRAPRRHRRGSEIWKWSHSTDLCRGSR